MLSQKLSSEIEIKFYLDIITGTPLIYTMDHPKLIVSNQKEESISILWLVSSEHSGSVVGQRGCGFEPHRCNCVASLSKTH